MLMENMYDENYIAHSLGLHLFFARIMKEHSLFLKAGFTGANSDFSAKAEFFKNEFEKLLSQAVTLSNSNVCEALLRSGEIVTRFTALAERQTERFTGISINKGITQRELALKGRETQSCNSCQGRTADISDQVRALNRRALRLVDGLISFKERILENVLDCRMFTANYPLLIEHILREAKLYRKYIRQLEENGRLNDETMKQTECFWNQIMMEHALFIRGLLDPTETELIEGADGFAKEYEELLKSCKNAQDKMTSDSLEQTKKFRDFKTAGVKGIEECQIRSVILPLLADHVLREANHYIRLMENEDC